MKMNKFRKFFFGKMHKDIISTIEIFLQFSVVFGVIGFVFFQLFQKGNLDPFWFLIFGGHSIAFIALSSFLYILGKIFAIIFPHKVNWRV